MSKLENILNGLVTPEQFDKLTPEEKRQTISKLIKDLLGALSPEDKIFLALLLATKMGGLDGLLGEFGDKNDPICPDCGLRHPPHSANYGDGLAYTVAPIDLSADPELNDVLKRYMADNGPRMHWTYNSDSSAYMPGFDVIGIRALDENRTDENATTPFNMRRVILHEIAHSTGHKSRLKRRMATKGENIRAYFKEEIIAERATQIILQTAGMMTPENKRITDEYIAHHAKGFEQNEGMTLGEVRMLCEDDAIAAAELILGKKLQRKRKEPEQAPQELVTAMANSYAN